MPSQPPQQPDGGSVSVEAVVRRKAPSLPRFVEIPAAALDAWDLSGTTPVRVALNDTGIGRRNLKAWGGDRDVWFFDLTERQCRRAKVDTDDPVTVVLRQASTEPPPALQRLIDAEPDARRAWDDMTDGQRRMLADHVRSAKREATRERRARKALLD